MGRHSHLSKDWDELDCVEDRAFITQIHKDCTRNTGL